MNTLFALLLVAQVSLSSPGFVDQLVAPVSSGVGPLPEFIAAGTAAATVDGSNVTPTLPSHQTGDILLAAQKTINTGTPAVETAGWTQIGSTTTVGTHKFAWYWKRAASASETNPEFSGGVNTFVNYAQTYCYRGAVSSGTPFEDETIWSSADPGTTTDPLTSTVTTTGANRTVVCLRGSDNDVAWTTSPPPAGWTLDNDVTTLEGADASLTAISIEASSAGDVSSVTIGIIGSAQEQASVTLALIPQ